MQNFGGGQQGGSSGGGWEQKLEQRGISELEQKFEGQGGQQNRIFMLFYCFLLLLLFAYIQFSILVLWLKHFLLLLQNKADSEEEIGRNFQGDILY